MIEPPEDPYPATDPDLREGEPEEALDPLPAQDIAAEQAVLGAVMLSQAALDKVSGVLRAEDFYRPAHGVLWATVLRLALIGPVDVLLVGDELDFTGQLKRCGGLPYLHTLIHAVPSVVNVEYWARIVVEKATLRRVEQAGMRIQHLAESGRRGADPRDVLEFVRREVEDATADRVQGGGLVPASSAVWEMIERLDEPLVGVVRTPWPTLNNLLNGGLYPGELVYVAARTSVGKSLVGNALTKAAAQDGLPALMWSMEMSRDQVMARLVADVGTVPLAGLISRTLSSEDRDRAKRAAERIAELPIWVDDTPGMSVAGIRSGSRRLTKTPGLIVADYLGLMKPARGGRSRQEDVAGMSGDLLALAKDLGCPVVVLHQLNRGPENRLSKRPTKADLRESGATEQDAHKIMLLWRPEDRENEITVILDKHRNGPTGEVVLDFHGRYAQISSGDPYRNMGGHR